MPGDIAQGLPSTGLPQRPNQSLKKQLQDRLEEQKEQNSKRDIDSEAQKRKLDISAAAFAAASRANRSNGSEVVTPTKPPPAVSKKVRPLPPKTFLSPNGLSSPSPLSQDSSVSASVSASQSAAAATLASDSTPHPAPKPSRLGNPSSSSSLGGSNIYAAASKAASTVSSPSVGLPFVDNQNQASKAVALNNKLNAASAAKASSVAFQKQLQRDREERERIELQKALEQQQLEASQSHTPDLGPLLLVPSNPAARQRPSSVGSSFVMHPGFSDMETDFSDGAASILSQEITDRNNALSAAKTSVNHEPPIVSSSPEPAADEFEKKMIFGALKALSSNVTSSSALVSDSENSDAVANKEKLLSQTQEQQQSGKSALAAALAAKSNVDDAVEKMNKVISQTAQKHPETTQRRKRYRPTVLWSGVITHKGSHALPVREHSKKPVLTNPQFGNSASSIESHVDIKEKFAGFDDVDLQPSAKQQKSSVLPYANSTNQATDSDVYLALSNEKQGRFMQERLGDSHRSNQRENLNISSSPTPPAPGITTSDTSASHTSSSIAGGVSAPRSSLSDFGLSAQQPQANRFEYGLRPKKKKSKWRALKKLSRALADVVSSETATDFSGHKIQTDEAKASQSAASDHTLRYTMRKDPKTKNFNEDKPWKHHRNALVVLDKEKKRYEGLWSANKGIHIPYLWVTEYDTADEYAVGESPLIPEEYLDIARDEVHAVVVRELWRRSRLSDDILEHIWNLVDLKQDGSLDRDGFLVGMWLVDQCLYGRKLPNKVDANVWNSVARLSLKIRVKARKEKHKDIKSTDKKKKKSKSKHAPALIVSHPGE